MREWRFGIMILDSRFCGNDGINGNGWIPAKVGMTEKWNWRHGVGGGVDLDDLIVKW